MVDISGNVAWFFVGGQHRIILINARIFSCKIKFCRSHCSSLNHIPLICRLVITSKNSHQSRLTMTNIPFQLLRDSFDSISRARADEKQSLQKTFLIWPRGKLF